MSTVDLFVAISYFSIPAQILVSLYRYPRLTAMPIQILLLLILFALFIFLCGAGHLMRYAGQGDSTLFVVLNVSTAVISVVTAVYLLPLVPSVMNDIDESLQCRIAQQAIVESRTKLMTFMAFLCHEIRNPLFAITSSIDVLEDEDMSTEQESALSTISHSATLMLRLVNDVLDLSKLESGKLELEERDFDLRELLQNVATTAQALIKQKRKGTVKFCFDLAPDLPRIVRGDSVRVLQIAYNLLSNATKFTEQGRIELTVSLCTYDVAVANGFLAGRKTVKNDGNGEFTDSAAIDDEDFAMGLLQSVEEGNCSGLPESGGKVIVKLEISDTGPGIVKERLSRIFEPYSQSKMSDYRKHGGTGLGLSIVSKLLDRMGGSIEVESEVGMGSRFAVYLPFHVPECPALVMTGEAETAISENMNASSLPELLPTKSTEELVLQDEAQASKKLKKVLHRFNLPDNEGLVLVVDDNAVNRKLIGRMLTHFNVDFRQAENGQEAVDIMLQSRCATGDQRDAQFDLILMDMSMPVMDGAEAMKTLRAHNITTPIVALTANAIDEHRDEALHAGATSFATKPILRDDLYELCRSHLSVP